jgi:hypothetical protein
MGPQGSVRTAALISFFRMRDGGGESLGVNEQEVAASATSECPLEGDMWNLLGSCGTVGTVTSQSRWLGRQPSL